MDFSRATIEELKGILARMKQKMCDARLIADCDRKSAIKSNAEAIESNAEAIESRTRANAKDATANESDSVANKSNNEANESQRLYEEKLGLMHNLEINSGNNEKSYKEQLKDLEDFHGEDK